MAKLGSQRRDNHVWIIRNYLQRVSPFSGGSSIHRGGKPKFCGSAKSIFTTMSKKIKTGNQANWCHPSPKMPLIKLWFSLLSIEWNLIRLGGPAHGIVAKTVHKTLLGVRI